MRVSKTRNNILKLLPSGLMTASDLEKKIGVNKTTIYRELERLVTEDLVLEVEFGDGKKRYELARQDHHHHAVCIKCDVVKDVKVDERYLSPKVKGFSLMRHSVEFFGLCENCL